MNKSLLVVWGLVWALFGCTPSDPPLAPQTTQTSAQSSNQNANSGHLLLWRVSDPAHTPPQLRAYLLGSIHVASADLYPLDPRIEQGFADSDRLVLETDPTDPRAADLMAKFVEDSMLPRGQTIYDGMNPQIAARLRERFSSLDVDPDRFAGFKLWFVSMTLSMLELDRAGFTGDNGIDAHFQLQAKKRKLPLLTLEPLEAQIQLLMNMGADANEQELAHQLETDTVAELRRMMHYWRTGSGAELAAELDEMRTRAPLAFDALFTQRNRRMAAELQTLMAKSGRYFVVVGAGHLVGKDSVVDELRAKGYQVEQY
jgi:uncharacterized protein YbaP (TraB family)